MNIDSLKSFPQWVCFTPAKKPINPQTGYGAKANDASTWASYDLARKRWASDKGQYAGIGYEFRKEQKITGIDLDKCIDEEGNITPWARAIVERLNSYTEYSPSGRGLHIWVQGDIPENIGPDPTGTTRIEMYDQARYFTITGNRLPGTPETIEPRQEELTLLYGEVVQARKEAKENARQASSNGLDTKYGLKALETERKELAGSPNGSRNAQLNRAAYALGQLVAGNELTRATVEQALTDAALACGLDDREIEKTLASGLESGMKSPRSAPAEQAPARNSYPCTDLGNAERFAARYAKRARWCETWNCWMIFNGKCWEKDRCGRVDQFAKMTTRAIYKEAAEEDDDQARAKQNIGVNIDITPRTHHDDDVSLVLKVAVTSMSGSGFGGLPTFGNREISTVIRLRDGETNMLAGLIRDEERRTLDGIPGLSDIPGVGRLFAHTQRTTNQTDIVLTLTPHIIRVLDLDEADLRAFRVGRDTLVPLAALPPVAPVEQPVTPPPTTPPPTTPPAATLPPTTPPGPTQPPKQ